MRLESVMASLGHLHLEWQLDPGSKCGDSGHRDVSAQQRPICIAIAEQIGLCHADCSSHEDCEDRDKEGTRLKVLDGLFASD